MIPLITFIAVAAVIGFYFVNIYNNLILLRNQYLNAFKQIDVQLKRRYDLGAPKGVGGRNSDNTISIIITNVDPAVVAGSPAEKSRGYAVGAARVFGSYTLSDTASQAYNAELVKQLTPAMQAIIATWGSPIE